MNPFIGDRWYEPWPERIAWHAITIGVLGFLLIVLMVTIDSLGEPAPPVDAGPPARVGVPVETEPVRTGSAATRMILPGVVEPIARVELGFRVDGHVAGFRVAEGAHVEVGEVIADLDVADLDLEVGLAEAALQSARATAADAEARHVRARRLFAEHSTPSEQVDQTQLAHELARTRLTQAELHLAAARARRGQASLRAPFAGVVEQRLIEAHEHTSVLQPVVVLTDFTRVRVRAAIPDDLLSRLRAGAPARVRAAAWPERVFEGEVERIDVSVDALTRTVPFSIRVENASLALRPQLGVEVELQLPSPQRRASLPVAAVLRDADRQPFCFVVKNGGPEGPQAERRPVVLGEVVRDRISVLAGLTPGERVVVRGQHFVHAGDALDVVRSLEN